MAAGLVAALMLSFLCGYFSARLFAKKAPLARKTTAPVSGDLEMDFYSTLEKGNPKIELEPGVPSQGNRFLKMEKTEGPTDLGSGKPQGVEPVVEAVADGDDARPGKDPEDKRYTVQIASFQDEARAKELVKQLRAKDYPAYHVEVDLAEKGLWNRVQVGRFKLAPDAQKAADKMMSETIIKLERVSPYVKVVYE